MATKHNKVVAYDIRPPRTKSRDHVIICSLMKNEKSYISSCTSPVDTGLDRVVVQDMELQIKKHILLSKKFLPLIHFSLP